MAFIQSSSFLRNVLALDAAACAATGLLLSFGAGALAGLLGFPAEFLRGAGLVLLPCARRSPSLPAGCACRASPSTQ